MVESDRINIPRSSLRFRKSSGDTLLSVAGKDRDDEKGSAGFFVGV